MIFICTFVLVIVYFKYNENKKRLKLSKEEELFSIKEPEKFDPDNMATILIIPESDLTVAEDLGSGAFGQVFLGYWKTKIPDENEEMKSIKFN